MISRFFCLEESTTAAFLVLLKLLFLPPFLFCFGLPLSLLLLLFFFLLLDRLLLFLLALLLLFLSAFGLFFPLLLF